MSNDPNAILRSLMRRIEANGDTIHRYYQYALQSTRKGDIATAQMYEYLIEQIENENDFIQKTYESILRLCLQEYH